jgi:4,5-DOPA dioxygenase extradiol
MMRAPVYFIGHGSPMNALEQNEFTRSLGGMRELFPKPKAILCISAHWMTEGSWVTAMPKPKTIHDFYGFPKELFEVQYPAAGDPKTATLICDQISDVHPDSEVWGLDAR